MSQYPTVKTRVSQELVEMLEAHFAEVAMRTGKPTETMSQFIRRAMKRTMLEDLRRLKNKSKNRSSFRYPTDDEDYADDAGIVPSDDGMNIG